MYAGDFASQNHSLKRTGVNAEQRGSGVAVEQWFHACPAQDRSTCSEAGGFFSSAIGTSKYVT